MFKINIYFKNLIIKNWYINKKSPQGRFLHSEAVVNFNQNNVGSDIFDAYSHILA